MEEGLIPDPNTLWSDNLVCKKCGASEWKAPPYGGRLLCDPPGFVYNCVSCQKVQYFTFIHEKDGRGWHKLPEDQIVCLPSPALDKIKADPQKWLELRKRIDVCTTIDIRKRRCDCCKKVVDEAYVAKVTMDDATFVAIVHDESTGFKFCGGPSTKDPKKFVVVDICNIGRYCYSHNDATKYIMLIAEKDEYEKNDRDAGQEYF